MKKHFYLAILPFLLFGCSDPNIREDTAYEERSKTEYLENKSSKPSAYLNDIASVFNDYDLVMPNGNRIRVCSAYSCTHKQVYRLSADTLREAKSKLTGVAGNWTADAERRGLADALQYIESVMAPATNTSADLKGGNWYYNGNSSHLNHIDEALNTTSILLVMIRYEMLAFHDLLAPAYVKGTFYPRIRDRSTGDIYVIDTGYTDSGGEVKIFNVKDENL